MENRVGNNWKFHHVAVVVKDMDRTSQRYESLGVGVFRPETMLDSGTFSTYEVYGKSVPKIDKSRFKHNDIGAGKFDVEFISPVAGDPIYKDFLEKHGEGLHHVAFTVDDLDAEKKRLEGIGIPCITSVKRPTGRGFAYFDFGDCLIELIGPVKP
jgi:methylmalonyl-CoA/ethylmalonyl-CoA epimerase